MVGSRDGSYSQADYSGDSIVNIMLKEPVKLEVHVHVRRMSLVLI